MLRELPELPGVLVLEPDVYPDARGTFHEWFRAADFQAATGHAFDLQQANLSTSRRGVLRGIHYADVPPGQAKYVTCPAGAIVDVIVDLRRGSPTFGRHACVELSAANHRAVYLPVGFGHGFQALEDSVVVYLTTAGYNPAAEHGVSPFDLGIDWPLPDPILSEKDAAAPLLADAPLPDYATCRAWEESL